MQGFFFFLKKNGRKFSDSLKVAKRFSQNLFVKNIFTVVAFYASSATAVVVVVVVVAASWLPSVIAYWFGSLV